MTGPFDDGARMAPSLPAPLQRVPLRVTGADLFWGAPVTCGARWSEIGERFSCRCIRDRRYPHICQCTCRAVRP